MIRANSLNQTERRRRSGQYFDGHVRDFVNSCDRSACESPPKEPGEPWPQAFLVEQSPGFVIPVHFHRRNQFQVITSGTGSMGRHPLSTLSLHYASADSGYGPITAGPEGLSYLTLRAVSEFGANVLPAARDRIRKGIAKYQVTAEPPKRISAEDLARIGEPLVETLISPKADGLAGYFVRMPPNHVMRAPSQAPCGGRFYIVTLGSLRAGDAWVPALATVFVSPNESFELVSGPEGLEALIAQFPIETEPIEPPVLAAMTAS